MALSGIEPVTFQFVVFWNVPPCSLVGTDVVLSDVVSTFRVRLRNDVAFKGQKIKS
jgi:hypothetical protein